MASLSEWLMKNTSGKQIKLEIGLDKVVFRHPQTRYFSVFVNGKNITEMVANALGRKTSYSKDTNGSMIVHGCGMDMGFAVQNAVYKHCCSEGYPDLIDRDDYTYLGRRKYGRYVLT